MKWLKRILIVAAILFVLLVGAVALLIDRMQRPNESRALSGAWVAEVHYAWNPDGKMWTALARRKPGSSRTKEVVKRVLEYRDLGDDCVAYSTYDYGLFVACGDRQPVLLTTSGSPELRADPIKAGDIELSPADLKRAGTETQVSPLGGDWWVQQPVPLPAFQGEHVLFIRDRRRYVDTVAEYRYLGENCVLYSYPSRFASVECGGHASIPLGKLDEGATIQNDPVRAGGRVFSQQELLKAALSADERPSLDW